MDAFFIKKIADALLRLRLKLSDVVVFLVLALLIFLVLAVVLLVIVLLVVGLILVIHLYHHLFGDNILCRMGRIIQREPL